MSLVNELESLVSFIQTIFPNKIVERQNIPPKPEANTFYLQFTRNESTMDTALQTKDGRVWDLFYVGISTVDTLDVMDTIKRAIYQSGQAIPIVNTDYYLRVNWFNFTNPFKNENNQDLIIATFRTESRTANILTVPAKVQHVSVKNGNITINK